MQAPRAAARVEPWNAEVSEAADARTAEFVVGNEDDDAPTER